MDYSFILGWLNGLNPIVHLVLAILGSLVVVGTIYVQLAPASAAGTTIAKIEAAPIIGPILTALMAFSVIERKTS